jgi:ATP adenylyltransferase
MSVIRRRLQPGTLWAKVQSSTPHAIRCGAIQSIPTRYELVEDGGVNFLIRIVSDMTRKKQDASNQRTPSPASGRGMNPFLPYDEDLFVADISDTHVCLLNKFHVLDYHILMVTRSFQEQESLLTLKDCEALLLCLAEYEGLVFYNAGQTAGASQRHKHLQMVPLPLTAEVNLPIAPLVNTAGFQGRIGYIPDLQFVHVLTRMHPEWWTHPDKGAPELWQQYLEMVPLAGLPVDSEGEGRKFPGPYNLLVTRQWILLVPRSAECFEGISVNALGYAGGFLVKDEAQLGILKRHGPMTALNRVAIGPSSVFYHPQASEGSG